MKNLFLMEIIKEEKAKSRKNKGETHVDFEKRSVKGLMGIVNNIIRLLK